MGEDGTQGDSQTLTVDSEAGPGAEPVEQGEPVTMPMDVQTGVWLRQGDRVFHVPAGTDLERRLVSEGFEYAEAPEAPGPEETGEPGEVGRSGRSRKRAADTTG